MNDPGKVWQGLTSRPLFIWGAGQQGRGICSILLKKGFHVRGFIDSSEGMQGREVFGQPVLSPQQALSHPEPRPLVIISSFFFEEEILAQCASFGLDKDTDTISYKRLKPFDYAVDISGTCNLRCISCPRASRHERHPPAGFMSAETFEQVLEKILREDPLVGNLQLYQWGEPLLNPQLPQILEIARRKAVPCAISSNLNLNLDLTPIIKAKPGWFRVSVSGTDAQYEKTHTGGHWPTLIKNMHELAKLRTKFYPDMKTEVYYHLYKHNQGESLQQVQVLCQELDFEFHPVWAYLISLDDVLESLEGNPLTPEARSASEMLALDLESGMALARAERHEECLVERCIHINWNLTVSHCMMFFYPQNNLATTNFLKTPLAQIQKSRKACRLCQRCRGQALHRYCNVYATVGTAPAQEQP